jgi:hypothetical protein
LYSYLCFFYPTIPAYKEFKKNDRQDVIFWDIYRDYAFNDDSIYHPSGRFSSPFQTLVGEVVLAVAPEVVSFEVVVQAADGNH